MVTKSTKQAAAKKPAAKRLKSRASGRSRPVAAKSPFSTVEEAIAEFQAGRSVIVTDDEVTSLNGDSADAHWSADGSCRSPLLSRPLDAQPGREHRESDLTKIFGIADMAFDDQTT